MSELDVGTLTNQDVQLCKAWADVSGSGTVAINEEYGFSSISDDGVGVYTLTFAETQADALYASVGTSLQSTGVFIVRLGVNVKTTTQVSIHHTSTAAAATDGRVCVAIFGN